MNDQLKDLLSGLCSNVEGLKTSVKTLDNKQEVNHTALSARLDRMEASMHKLMDIIPRLETRVEHNTEGRKAVSSHLVYGAGALIGILLTTLFGLVGVAVFGT